jgi:hypothetical protein
MYCGANAGPDVKIELRRDRIILWARLERRCTPIKYVALVISMIDSGGCGKVRGARRSGLQIGSSLQIRTRLQIGTRP